MFVTINLAHFWGFPTPNNRILMRKYRPKNTFFVLYGKRELC